MDFYPLVEYLLSVFPELEGGRNLFVNSMPTDIFEEKFEVLLRDYSSGIQIDKDIPDYRYGRFQMASRGYDYRETLNITRRISKALTINAKTFGDLQIKHLRPLHEPIAYMNSKGGYHEFYVSFFIIFALSPNEDY